MAKAKRATPKKQRARRGVIFAEIGVDERAALDARVAELNARGNGRWAIGMLIGKLVRDAVAAGWGEAPVAPAGGDEPNPPRAR